MAVEGTLRAGRIRLHVGIATIFVVIVAALTAGIIWNNHRQASAAALQTADQLFTVIARNVDERMNRMLGGVKATVDAASAMPSLSGRPRYDGLSHPALEPLLRMIETQPYVFSVFVGFGSGDWIQVCRTARRPGDTGDLRSAAGSALHRPHDQRGTGTASATNTCATWIAAATSSARAARRIRPTIRGTATGTKAHLPTSGPTSAIPSSSSPCASRA